MRRKNRRIKWFGIAVFAAILAASCGINKRTGKPAKRNSEKYYSDLWCKQQGGKAQVRLKDGTIADCITAEYAAEFDFGKPHKGYECTGQALHYAETTGLKPLCILIWGAGISAAEFATAIGRIPKQVELRCINKNAEIFDCKKATQ